MASVSDSVSDSSSKAWLYNILRFDSNGTDQSLPLRIDDEINESETRRKKLEDWESQLAAEVPVLFGTSHARRREARNFLKWPAKPRADYPVAKACNWSRGDKLWDETWLGITWVALQCTDSLCVVVRNSDLVDMEQELVRFRGIAIENFTSRFWNAIVSNVEDIKEKELGSSCVQCFSVVAVGAAGKGQEALTEAINLAKKTSNFLHERLKSDPSLTSEEAIQTAILATRYMFGQKFEAEELRVFLWKKEEFIAEELQQKRDNHDLEDPDLDLEDIDLEDLLACINGSDNDDSGMLSSIRRCMMSMDDKS